MALASTSHLKRFLSRCNLRNFSSGDAVKKTVLISQSQDIYTNLALEDWIYKNYDFTNNHILMLWQNDPCVVIGRHQNPWLEANVANLDGIKLARRNSGGGTVYHDTGNLNMTFFTPREEYNRKYNLEVITRALYRKYALKVDISPREDLTLRGCKISGTAAKLGRPSAYHHCTLLVQADKSKLSRALHKTDIGIETNATRSIASKVMNLCEENGKVNVKSLIQAVGWEYLRTTALAIQDGGMELANKQNGFQMVNPTDDWFPGIVEIRDNLRNWDWCFGKTPKFSVSRSYPMIENVLLNNNNNNNLNANDVKVTMTVENGKISDVTLYLPNGLVPNLTGPISVVTHLKGCKFEHGLLSHLDALIASIMKEKYKNISDCVQQVMTSV